MAAGAGAGVDPEEGDRTPHEHPGIPSGATRAQAQQSPTADARAAVRCSVGRPRRREVLHRPAALQEGGGGAREVGKGGEEARREVGKGEGRSCGGGAAATSPRLESRCGT